MPAFDAGLVVEELSYDFTYFYRQDNELYAVLKDAQGTVPEPSDEMVQRFQKKMSSATVDLIPEGVDPDDRVAMVKAMAAMPEEKFTASEASILDALAELSRGQPSREQLVALPFRVKRKFVQWLTKELMDPESLTAATTP